MLEFFRNLATIAGAGVAASYVMQLVKLIFPRVADEIAVRVSVIVAGVIALGAYLLLPYLQNLPPIIGQIWPVLSWLASYIWFELVLKKRPAA